VKNLIFEQGDSDKLAKACKILFISAPIGAGHIRAAQAVSAALYKYDASVETKTANVFDFFNPYIGDFILKTYFKILKLFPSLYGKAYSWGNESYLALLCRKVISRYLAGKMEKYIKEYNPAVIVCTHATPAGLVAHLLKTNRLHIPVVAIVTDFVVHRLWIYPEIKHYIVAHEKMRDFLLQSGIQADGIQVMGIPIDEKFACRADKKQRVEQLSFKENCKTILLMGGGAGLLPMDEIVLCCEKMDISLRIIVVTGSNKAMYDTLVKLKPSLRHRVDVLGYVDHINELMAIADVIISKPGGMTSAEMLCQGTPMLIYRPIPGQEEENAEYLIKSHVALRADSLAEVGDLLKQLLLDHPEELMKLHENALALSQPMSASRIAEYIFSTVYKETSLF